MRFEVLGPLRVHTAGAEITIGSGRERTLLAMLLLHANRTVAYDQLVEAIWADQPPPGARNQLQGCVSRLRKRLTTTGLEIFTEPGGYRATVAPDDLDLLDFRRLVAQARTAAAAGEPTEAVTAYRAALALWRGPALGGTDTGRTHAAAALDEEHIQIREECIEAELATGAAGRLVPELTELVGQHPHRERLHASLMHALYRADRQADALAAYRHARITLHDELGIEPGAELQRLHQAILNRDPDLTPPPVTPAPTSAAATSHPPTPTPRELPADVTGFTGRTEAIKSLNELLADNPHETPAPVVISAIAGTAGVGKTALAVHWAHRVADRFPDGQLYLNLRGYAATTPVRPIEALSALLRSLGTPPEQIPTDEAQAAALYRTQLAGCRALIVLDNARSVDQIRPLLPGSPGCLVLITSRDRLTGLVARDGARRLTLDVLTPDEARTLLSALLGTERIKAEPDAVSDLAQACAHLPLALRIAAAHLNDRRETAIATYAAELRSGSPLTDLQADYDQDSAVRGALEPSYRTLAAETQRTFRLLGLVPGPTFTAAAAAALADTSSDKATTHLQRLVGAHLVEELSPDRYRFHDLLRSFASEAAHTEEPQTVYAAIERLFDFYLHTAHEAAAVAYPASLRAPLRSANGVEEGALFKRHGTALKWLTDELPNLLSTVTFAAQHGPRQVAWLLACDLRTFLSRRGCITEWFGVASAAMRAARETANPLGLAAAHLCQADLYRCVDQYTNALVNYSRAVDLAQLTGWLDGHTAALGNLGATRRAMGQLSLAADAYSRALTLDHLTRPGAEAINSGNLGLIYYEQGKLQSAVRQLMHALRLFERVGRYAAATCLSNLACAHHELGNLEEACKYATRSLDFHRQLGDRSSVASVLGLLAEIHGDAGRLDVALNHAQDSLRLAQRIDEPRSRALALNNLGHVQARCGMPREALDSHLQALESAQAIGYRTSEISALLGIATAKHRIGDLEPAAEAAIRCRTLSCQAGYQVFEGRALTCLSGILLGQGREADARVSADNALKSHRTTGHRLGEARTLTVLASLSSDTGQQDEAARLWREALRLFAYIGIPAPNDLATVMRDHRESSAKLVENRNCA